jgi:aminoglycoside phosphotransferase (APT) family kinase protein
MVHQILRSQGVRLPGVLYVTRLDRDLGRSIMVTSEVAGCPVGSGKPPNNVRAILREAGRDLALINRLPVDGFGWIQNELNRDGKLQAEFPTYAEWINHHIGDCTDVLKVAAVLVEAEAQAIDELMRVEAGKAASAQAFLAHGDFDVTHIYHVGGVYSGIIDFGEIRGAPALYDLAHFQIENRDLLPDLLEGYEQLTTLPPNYRRTIDFFSLLIALRRLTRHVQTGRKPLLPDLAAVRRWGLPSS